MMHQPPVDPPPDPPEEPCFVTWDKALEKITENLAFVITRERELAKERMAEALLTALGSVLRENAGLLQALRIWHEAKDYECCAHSEGQVCCIDDLLGSTEPSA